MYRIILVSVLLISAHIAPPDAGAQVIPPARPNDPSTPFSRVERAYLNGEITLDEQMLQKFYIAVDRERVMERFLPIPEDLKIRCLTPLLIEYEYYKERLLSVTRSEIEALTVSSCSPGDTDHTFISPSGRFAIHYNTSGNDAVPGADVSGEPGVPDYIESVALAADSSWAHQIGTIGFVDPLVEETVYDIYFRDFGFYGLTCTNSGNNSTHIVLHNSYEGFLPNSHPEGDAIGALYATVAHEFKHASQYTTNRWQSHSSETSFERESWLEMDATMMEEVVFDDSNDYYNYIKTGGPNHPPHANSLFGSPDVSIPGSYYHMTWMLYFRERFGIDFWVDVWNQFLPEPDKAFLTAITEALAERGDTFGDHHTQNMAWHMASGPEFANSGFGFIESAAYPRYYLATGFDLNWSTIPDSTLTQKTLGSLSADFHRILPIPNTTGQVQIIATHDQPQIGLGLVARFRDGRTAMDYISGGSLRTRLTTNWEWDDIAELSVAVVSNNENSPTRYHLILENPIPEQLVLSNNYPNPFSDRTTIEFAVDRPLHVRLEITDQLGRLVQTLSDREYDQGIYQLEFSGQGLASGLYFYRIIAGGRQLARSMIYIRE